MSETTIEWATHVWNPVRGCSRTSPGCQHCYAERVAARFSDEGLWAHGFAERTGSGPRWTRKVELVPEKLAEPLSWRKARRVFVNSMSDLFHEDLTHRDIRSIVGVIAACPDHQFLTLTKRARLMRVWFEEHAECAENSDSDPSDLAIEAAALCSAFGDREYSKLEKLSVRSIRWPLPNWWLGVSVEDCERKARIDHLRKCPAAIRFLSCEPLLEDLGELDPSGIHWVIVGGESGPGARLCRLSWIDSIVQQAKEQGSSVFVKQHGSFPVERVVGGRVAIDGNGGLLEDDGLRLKYRSQKGGKPSEWPGGLGRFPRETPI